MDGPALSRVLTPAPPAKPSALKRLGEIETCLPAEADLILLGDSLAAGWPANLHALAFPERRVLNLGLPGDRIQNTLWRLDRSPAAQLRPRELVLLLGTNNLGDGDPADAILAGLAAVLGRAAALWDPATTIVVTVPRRGEPPGFREPERRALNAAVSIDLASFPDRTVLDADAALRAPSGEAPSLLPDLLHLSEHGYARLSRALGALLRSNPAHMAGVRVQASDAATPGFVSDEKR